MDRILAELSPRVDAAAATADDARRMIGPPRKRVRGCCRARVTLGRCMAATATGRCRNSVRRARDRACAAARSAGKGGTSRTARIGQRGAHAHAAGVRSKELARRVQNAARTDQLARRVEETQRSTDDRLTHAETEAAKAAAALNGLFRRTDEVLTATP